VQAHTIYGGVHVHLPAPSPVTPRQLPSPPRWFSGRWDELVALTAALEEGRGSANTVVISAVAGAGGIGKTALTLHWAHRNLHHFPDGQLFVNLRGFDPSGTPMSPATAVRILLHALGVDGSALPADLEAQSALYRSLVATKRMLVVLDNAASVEQVAPLLPGDPTCMVIVTSRNRLPGLVTSHGAQGLRLDVLTPEQSRALLAARLGTSRLQAEPGEVDQMVAYCGGFPLALSIVAGHAEAYPDFTLSALAAELRDTAARLDALDDDDPASSLPAVLSWSYAALSPEQAEVFLLLALAPGPDISTRAAASLIAAPVGRTRVLLRDLERRSLVQQPFADRYRMHDLVRLHAAERAQFTLPEPGQEPALRRIVDYYLHTAHSSEMALFPDQTPLELGRPADGCRPHPPASPEEAMTWFDAEHACLLAAQEMAQHRGWHAIVRNLAWALDTFHWRRGRLHEDLIVWQASVLAAEQDGSPVARVYSRRRLGWALARAGRYREALDYLNQAQSLAEQCGDLDAQARIQRALAWTYGWSGDNEQALEHANRSLLLSETLEGPQGGAGALNAVGRFATLLGRYDEAYAALQKALIRNRKAGANAEGEADTLEELGHLEQHRGRLAEALDYNRQAAAICHDLGDTYQEAEILDRTAQIHLDLDQRDQARTTWLQVLALYQAQQRTADAARVQHQLDALTTASI
jgi:tetratricopeptide (TPR) repeat protein